MSKWWQRLTLHDKPLIRWEMTAVSELDVQSFLNEGWQPFAVSMVDNPHDGFIDYTIWLRRAQMNERYTEW